MLPRFNNKSGIIHVPNETDKNLQKDTVNVPSKVNKDLQDRLLSLCVGYFKQLFLLLIFLGTYAFLMNTEFCLMETDSLVI